MIDYEYVNRKFADLSATLLVPTFRKLALTYCVSAKDFYDALELYCDLRGDEIYEDGHKERIDKYRLRLIRIANRLNVVNTEQVKNEVLFEGKVYDCRLKASMVAAYRYLAESIGDLCIASVSDSTLTRSIDIVNRDGFSVVEFTLLLCLFTSIQGRTVGKLNMPVTTENERKRARGSFRKIKDVLFSKELESVLVDLLLDGLMKDHQRNYDDNLYKHLRDFWILESKRKLKTAQYAVKCYGKSIDKTYYKDADFDVLSAADQMRLLKDNEDIARTQWLFFTVLPLTEAYMDGALPSDIDELIMLGGTVSDTKEKSALINIQSLYLKSNVVPFQMKEHIKNMPPSYYEVSAEECLIAQRFALAIKGYIGEVRKSVVTLLEVLPEAQISGKQGLWEYMLRL